MLISAVMNSIRMVFSPMSNNLFETDTFFFLNIYDSLYHVLNEMTTIENSTETNVFSPDILISKTL